MHCTVAGNIMNYKYIVEYFNIISPSLNMLLVWLFFKTNVKTEKECFIFCKLRDRDEGRALIANVAFKTDSY